MYIWNKQGVSGNACAICQKKVLEVLLQDLFLWYTSLQNNAQQCTTMQNIAQQQCTKEGKEMEQESRIAVMAIIVENRDSVDELNTLLHEYGNYIVGRMGLPYEKKNLHIVSIALDAPNDTISALAGKIGNISGISVKTAYANA